MYKMNVISELCFQLFRRCEFLKNKNLGENKAKIMKKRTANNRAMEQWRDPFNNAIGVAIHVLEICPQSVKNTDKD